MTFAFDEIEALRWFIYDDEIKYKIAHQFDSDSVEYNWNENKTFFYLYDELVGEIITDYYTFTAPAKKRIERTGDVHHFVWAPEITEKIKYNLNEYGRLKKHQQSCL